jgi:hypothetical protein
MNDVCEERYPMILETVFTLAENLCCGLALNSDGGIDILGAPQDISRLLPIIRENRNEVLRHLRLTETTNNPSKKGVRKNDR